MFSKHKIAALLAAASMSAGGLGEVKAIDAAGLSTHAAQELVTDRKVINDLLLYGTKTSSGFVVSPARVEEIKTNLSKFFGRPVDKIDAVNGSALVSNTTTGDVGIIFASEGQKYVGYLSGTEKGKSQEFNGLTKDLKTLQQAPQDFNELRAGSRELASSTSFSSSAQVWLGVFAGANEVLKGKDPTFNGHWELPQDPLGIEAKIPEAQQAVAELENISGYSLKIKSGYGPGAIDEINSFLKENDLAASLKPDSSAGVVAAGVEIITPTFANRGTDYVVSCDGTRYNGFKKTDGIFRLSSITGQEPVVEIPTNEGVGVYLVKLSAFEQALHAGNTLQVAEKVTEELATKRNNPTRPSSFVAPDVDFHVTSQPEWLIGAKPVGIGEVVSQAVLETKFSMDKSGVISKTGAVMATSRGISPAPYKFDEPFLVITFVKNNPEKVLNASLINADSWTIAD